MLSKRSLLTFTALALASLFSLSSTAQAQNGYRGYIGPSSDVYANAPYASIYRNVSPGLISLGEEFIKSPKSREMAASAGEYLRNHPQARETVGEAGAYLASPQGRQKVRRAKNYIQSPQGQRSLDAASVFMDNPNPIREEVLNEISSGSNFNFLAESAVGYLRTGQMDLVGNKLTVNRGGGLGAEVYDVRTYSNGRIEIDLPEGTTASGRLQADGSGATMKLMTHGVAIPVNLTNYMPNIEKHPGN